MNWEAAGAIGEILAAVAVVISLVYVGTQIRQNTKALHSSTRNAWLVAVQKTNELQLMHPEIWHKGAFEHQTLAGEDRSTFRTLASSAFNAFEALYLEYLEGNVDETLWSSKSRTLGFVLASPMGKDTWKVWKESGLADDRFAKYVEREVLTRDA